jgi:hypothetical protein
MHVGGAREVLEHCLSEVARSAVAAESKVRVELGEERTSAALLTQVVPLLAANLIRPMPEVELLAGRIRPVVGDDLVLVPFH